MTDQTDINSEDLRIRPVDSSHIADLIRIADETNLSAWTAQNYLDEFQMPGSIMLRLESALNVTIGFVVGRIVEGGVVESEQQAEIYNIAIDKSEQGKGFGQLLFDAFIEKCNEQNVTSVWLEVRESNEKAIGFYKSNGFEHVQSRNNFYDNPREAALLMKLVLK
ncbi:MAG TPA: ribosomal protein S18-alanine N-acetyltransferase [Pyrinomonadaceae bacterium]|nr:ribosomal protein S18-alanine N-acetyltransferase [Pyrinomonadaceae bacterium]